MMGSPTKALRASLTYGIWWFQASLTTIFRRSEAASQPFVGQPGKLSVYLTEPVIPSANCFCRMKKITMVGTEQNSTPIISIP